MDDNTNVVSVPSRSSRLLKGAGGEATGFADRYAAARPLEYASEVDKLNHNVFRYPAKFHPPIAGALIDLVTETGQTVWDPFCGSGTLLIEAAVRGRNCIGSDIDPLAIFIAHAKSSLTEVDSLIHAADKCKLWAERRRTADKETFGEFLYDISPEHFGEQARRVQRWIPELPNLSHWFRRRATIQLATMRRYIHENYSGQQRLFLQLCFGSIIRGSSNADPVPVSGLEVTSHMLAKEAKGRIVDPWTLLCRAIDKTITATASFAAARRPNVDSIVRYGDARFTVAEEDSQIDAVITSPPYLTAVDYYRRHTLEMYWLGLTNNRGQRLDLMRQYIGRDRVGLSHYNWDDARASDVADRWIPRFNKITPERERAFRHYCDGMARSIAQMQKSVKKGGPVVIVAGDVFFCGTPVSMLELMNDLAPPNMGIADHLWYPILNRYMSYSRRNEANIAADHVLIFRNSN